MYNPDDRSHTWAPLPDFRRSADGHRMPSWATLQTVRHTPDSNDSELSTATMTPSLIPPGVDPN